MKTIRGLSFILQRVKYFTINTQFYTINGKISIRSYTHIYTYIRDGYSLEFVERPDEYLIYSFSRLARFRQLLFVKFKFSTFKIDIPPTLQLIAHNKTRKLNTYRWSKTK